MRLYTSYFYQIRFFPPNLVPLSTAKYDPNWFHSNRGNQFQFKDNRSVINGIRVEMLAPSDKISHYCSHGCEFAGWAPKCPFLAQYKKQLNEIDFNAFMLRLNNLRDRIAQDNHYEDVDFAFIVYEAPTNACSERVPIQEWFQEHDMNIQEWTR